MESVERRVLEGPDQTFNPHVSTSKTNPAMVVVSEPCHRGCHELKKEPRTAKGGERSRAQARGTIHNPCFLLVTQTAGTSDREGEMEIKQGAGQGC